MYIPFYQLITHRASLGLGMDFVPKKFHGIDSEQFLLFRGRKCSFRSIPRPTDESTPMLGMERNYMKKICFKKQPK
jgi:hypothetical protein